jgi:signal transduction histidine kinase
MKLGRKLVIMSLTTILVPMLIIVVFAAVTIFRNNAITQWEYLESIKNHIEEEMVESERNYLQKIKELAGDEMIRAKLYVYEKYWSRLTESLISYDLEPLTSLVENTALKDNIETLAVYRRDKDSFRLIDSNNRSKSQPEVFYKDQAEMNYNKVVYLRYSDGIHMRVLYPVFSDGKLVGLLLFMRVYDEVFLAGYRNDFGIDAALISNNKVMINSVPELNAGILAFLDDPGQASRRSFKQAGRSYSGLVRRFYIGSTASGFLVLYMERANPMNENRTLLIRLLLLSLLCVLIPGVAFFVKETRLINSINQLLLATNDISSGNYKTRVEGRSDDEIGLLNCNFNSMVRVLKTNRDELQQQNAELELKNSYIDAVFQSLRINIIVLDAGGRIRVVSRNAGSRLELSEGYQGKELLSVEPFKSAGAILKSQVSEVYKSGKFVRLYSIIIGNISYEADFYPVFDDGGPLSAVVLILNNITERMNMERALTRSDKLASIGTLAAGLAHEINNPLGIILNHVQLLGTGELTTKEEERFIDRIESEIKRVSRLINNLLKFSNEDTSAVERQNPGVLLVEVIGLIDPKAGAEAVGSFYNGTRITSEAADCYAVNFKGKRVRLYLPAGMYEESISCSRDSLKQIFFNIIKNSIESCAAEDGIIWCGLSKEPDCLRVDVSDNGSGISDKEKVFELFYSNSKTGSGIGLPLCRTLMNNIGGSISIEDSEGGGTKILLIFPLREDYYGKS